MHIDKQTQVLMSAETLAENSTNNITHMMVPQEASYLTLRGPSSEDRKRGRVASIRYNFTNNWRITTKAPNNRPRKKLTVRFLGAETNGEVTEKQQPSALSSDCCFNFLVRYWFQFDYEHTTQFGNATVKFLPPVPYSRPLYTWAFIQFTELFKCLKFSETRAHYH